MRRLITIILLFILLSPIAVNACSPAIPNFGMSVFIDDCNESIDYDIRFYLKRSEISDSYKYLQTGEGEWVNMTEDFIGDIYESNCYFEIDTMGDFFEFQTFESFRVDIYGGDYKISETVTFNGDLIGNDYSPEFTYSLTYNIEEDEFTIVETPFDPGNCGLAMIYGMGLVLGVGLLVFLPSAYIVVVFMNCENQLEFKRGNEKFIKPTLLVVNLIVAVMYASFLLNNPWLFIIPIFVFLCKQLWLYILDTSWNKRYVVFSSLIIIWPIVVRILVNLLTGY